MSQHSGSVSPLSEHPASPALLTNGGPHRHSCSHTIQHHCTPCPAERGAQEGPADRWPTRPHGAAQGAGGGAHNNTVRHNGTDIANTLKEVRALPGADSSQ